MYLGNLLKSVSKKHQKIPVNGISFDSREVKKKDIFFAIKGKNTSGVKFINHAINKGAVAIISNKKKLYNNKKIPFIYVRDVKKSLSEACNNFFKEKPKNIIAVTGTNGKSSVADFFYQILSLNKVTASSIGTLGIRSKKYNVKTKLTSLNPLSLHKNLQILQKNKVNNVILEASSHGLDQKRLDSLNINIGIFTNLSHDHLDYHKNMQSYLKSKMYLFKKLLHNKSIIITDENNIEFKKIEKLAKKRKLKTVNIGNKSGYIKILSNKYIDDKQLIKISINSKTLFLTIPLVGYFQIKNLLMAVIAASNCGININKIFKRISKIKPVPGRLEIIKKLKNSSRIILDFAHTPEALEKSLIEIKNQFNKKIVLVFGCGGSRDKKKRFIMGKIAKKYCHKVYITDDNPREENPKKIRNAIIRGCRNIATDIANRRKAIKTAIKSLKGDEVLLVAGKGHENTQDFGNKIIFFSDKKVIKEAAKEYKYYYKKNNYKNYAFFKTFSKKINYNGVSINTKTIKKNNLFFAIKGKKNDGHKFLKEAISKGAAKSIISRKTKNIPDNKVIKVKNTFLSLNQLAKNTRENSSAHIIGITGSVGKTTLKNLIGHSLKNYGNVYFAPHSYNNKFGVPISISNLKANTKYGVFEIGMDKKGEIDSLSKLLKPEVGVITNISEAHIKNFNNIKDIAKAKSEIINNIVKNGNIVLNKDDKFYSFLLNKAKKNNLNVTSFSVKKKADIYLLGTKKINNAYKLKVSVNNRKYNFKIKHSTTSFISNILACISVLFIYKLDLSKFINGFYDFTLPDGRGDIRNIVKFNKKFKFIDESYNANPLSMKSAINNMDYFKVGNKAKKIVILGDMLELGKKSKILHRKLSKVINKTNIDKVFVCGKYIRETFNLLSDNKKGKIFKDTREAYNDLKKIVHNNDLLMVKGSNATGLNEFSKSIKKGQTSAI